MKIGTALNPLKRLRDLQTGSSVPLRLIAMFPGGRKGEREFHDLYRGRRLAGEWFDDRDEHMSEILIKVAESSGIVWPQR